jgi:hypothetical protein
MDKTVVYNTKTEELKRDGNPAWSIARSAKGTCPAAGLRPRAPRSGTGEAALRDIVKNGWAHEMLALSDGRLRPRRLLGEGIGGIHRFVLSGSGQT